MSKGCDEFPLPDAKWRRSFRRKLLVWYARHARELPWRGTTDPYKVWVSEIMLQQTTTAAVERYYRRFLQRFPNVQSLAAASDAEVLRFWEGLGYYRRATQLHKAAKMIVSEHGGIFPNDFDTILKLPGVGRYTAGAICSIAYHQRRPILEANTIRLHARLLAYPDDPTRSAGNKLLWQMAELVLPEPNRNVNNDNESVYSLFNQAMMDLGSMVCTPKSPDCRNCPVVKLCRSAEQGLQHVIPALKKDKEFEERTEAALVIRKNGKFLMMRYPEGVRWAGLWDFPRYLMAETGRPDDMAEYRENIKRLTGREVVLTQELAVLWHSVTRYKITLKIFSAEQIGKKQKAEYQTEWFSQRELANLALNTTGRKIVGFLEKVLF